MISTISAFGGVDPTLARRAASSNDTLADQPGHTGTERPDRADLLSLAQPEPLSTRDG